jgi:hypothetical protein
MKRILLSLVLALPFSAGADLVARNGRNELRLIESPCVHGGTLAHLKEEWRPKFKKASATIGGGHVYACWIDTGDGTYYVLFESGESLLIPVQAMLDEPGV